MNAAAHRVRPMLVMCMDALPWVSRSACIALSHSVAPRCEHGLRVAASNLRLGSIPNLAWTLAAICWVQKARIACRSSSSLACSPLSRSEMSVVVPTSRSTIASFKLGGDQRHDDSFSDSTIAQASVKIWFSASNATATSESAQTHPSWMSPPTATKPRRCGKAKALVWRACEDPLEALSLGIDGSGACGVGG